jgi:hypothetical protein
MLPASKGHFERSRLINFIVVTLGGGGRAPVWEKERERGAVGSACAE